MNTKKCTQCLENKLFTEFYGDKKQSSGLRPNCKECCRHTSIERYKNNPAFRQRKLDDAAIYIKTFRKAKQVKILTLLKATGCKDCGEKDPIVLDFDHMRDKKKSVSAMLRNNSTWLDIELEIAKCEVRCSNCHRKKTARERNYYVGIDLDAL